MPASLEADTCVLQVSSGQSQPEEPPGLAAFSAPRRAARGREKDALYVCLHLRSRGPVPADRYSELIDLATQTFFGSPGSVTSALRLAMAAVNRKLLTDNLAATSGGAPAQGGLVAAVLRGADLYAVLSGPGMVLVAHSHSIERFPTLTSRSLGLSQNPDVQYFHTLVEAEEYFCLCNTIPDGWNERTLAGLGGLTTLTLVLERLKDEAKSDFSALVGRLETARGTPLGLPFRNAPGIRPIASLFRPSSRPPDAVEALSTPLAGAEAPAAPTPVTPGEQSPAPLPAEEQAQPVVPAATQAAGLAPAAETAAAQPAPAPGEQPAQEAPAGPVSSEALPELPAGDWPSQAGQPQRLEPVEALPSIPIIEEGEPIETFGRTPFRPARQAARGPNFLQRGLSAFGRALAVTFSETAHNIRRLVARTLPEGMLQQEGLFAVPTSVQIAIAVIIPLIVVGVAAVQYIQRGQEQQYNEALNQAMLEKSYADMAPDPVSQHVHWSQAQNWAEQARKLHPADVRSAALAQEAQVHLDQLDSVTRVDYHKLVASGLGQETRLKQILLMGTDIYALDGGGNRILHLLPDSGDTYQVDAAFACSGGTVGKYTISTLVGMALLPRPNLMDADGVVAMDKAGGLLYCAAGQKPLSAYLTPPDAGWKTVTAIAVYSDRLYVLDSGGSEIWGYQTSGGAYTQPPVPYFTTTTYDLAGVIDFAIATTSGEVFLLRQDGRMADCNRRSSSEAPTCVEVAKFSDTRAGRGPAERLWDVTQPLHLTYNPPPEPSLYLLDTGNSGLYQLSLKLELVRLYRPRLPLDGPITAMTTTTDQLLVGAGDNIYAANRP
jgi:hypothetical protein